MMADSSELGMAFGSAGATTVFMCVATTCRLGLCSKKTVELFLQGARRRLAGGQLVQNDLKYFGLHNAGKAGTSAGSLTNSAGSKISPSTRTSTICFGTKPSVWTPVSFA